MESLGVMGWGLVAAENSSAAAVAAAISPPSRWVDFATMGRLCYDG